MLDVKLVKTIKSENEALNLGGKLWEKGDMRRVYFNGNSKYNLLNITIEFYKTGAINHCFIDDQRISNNKAGELVWAKVYFDCNTNEVVYQSGSEKKVISA